MAAFICLLNETVSSKITLCFVFLIILKIPKIVTMEN